jgi:ABC-type nitrate/sulfonate/bicarbonate transport system permease component
LGAIIGEYFGGDSGMGVAMIHSQQAFEIERTWGLALVATAIAGIAYAITAMVGRALAPWDERKR